MADSMPGPAHRLALRGISVLITRPRGGCAGLVDLVEQKGGDALLFPAIDIAPARHGAALRAALTALDDTDLLVFVSVHAVRGVADLLRRHGLKIPPGARVAVTGPATAAACARAGITVHIAPQRRAGSEGLLAALDEVGIGGRRALIFRAQSGRELIQQTLQAHGVAARYVESYRRVPSAQPLAPLLARWQASRVMVVTASSGAVVDALITRLGRHRPLLARAVIAAYSPRVAAHCRALALGAPCLIAAHPTDQALVCAIVGWADGRGRGD